jgi:hypothetical protein
MKAMITSSDHCLHRRAGDSVSVFAREGVTGLSHVE